MKIDPKLGWHVVWVYPLATICVIAGAVVGYTEQRFHAWKINRSLKRNPEIKELSVLSNIKQDSTK